MQVIQWFDRRRKELLKKKPEHVALVLSGGATRGAAHIGVLQVLEREGILPSIVAGNSAGSIVGAAYAAGVPADEMSEIFHKLDWGMLARPARFGAGGIFTSRPMEKFIEQKIGELTFDQLPRQLAVVACDIVSGERVVLNEGLVARAVRASSAVPGLFKPVEIDGRLLVDGGVVENFPVSLAMDMGADYIIGVNVTITDHFGAPPNNFIQTIIAANSIRGRVILPDRDLINCLIEPDLRAYSSWDFEHSREMEIAGRIAAERALPQLMQDLGMN